LRKVCALALTLILAIFSFSLQQGMRIGKEGEVPEYDFSCFSINTLFNGTFPLSFRFDNESVQRLSCLSRLENRPVQSSVMPSSGDVGTGCKRRGTAVEGAKSMSDAVPAWDVVTSGCGADDPDNRDA
jgi:hypothetical protein